MNARRYSSLMFLLLISLSVLATEQIDYAKTYLEAREKAIKEHKPYLIIFSNDNCNPCEWMSEHTLGNKEVEEMVNRQFVAVKVDIDDFDGYALKKYYNIDKLPSILVFGPTGSEWQRIEEAITAERMLTILQNPKGDFSISKTQTDKPKPNPTNTTTSQDKPKPEPNPIKPAPPTVNTEMFAVQIGVFSSAENARELAGKIKRITSKEVMIKKEDNLYKVFSGPSETRAETEAHLQQLKDYGYKGFIKSISTNEKI